MYTIHSFCFYDNQTDYWKCRFLMNPHVRLSVGWMVCLWTVILFHAPIKALVRLNVSWWCLERMRKVLENRAIQDEERMTKLEEELKVINLKKMLRKEHGNETLKPLGNYDRPTTTY